MIRSFKLTHPFLFDNNLGWGAHAGSQWCQKSTSMCFQALRSCAKVRIPWGRGAGRRGAGIFPTRRRVKWGEHETYMFATWVTLPKQQQPFLDPGCFLKPGHWVRVYSNQRRVNILTFQYYSRCWNPTSKVIQFTLFCSLPPSLIFYLPPSSELHKAPR